MNRAIKVDDFRREVRKRAKRNARAAGCDEVQSARVVAITEAWLFGEHLVCPHAQP